jgi:uncharacterized protein YebE (UPF0316 family)
MSMLLQLPVWATAVFVFLLRIVDVSVGTIRTLAVVRGLIKISVVLGFFEVLIWTVAVSQVITRVHSEPLLLAAFAAGFAAGNAVGIALERRLGIGTCIVRIIVGERAEEVTRQLRGLGQSLVTFAGGGDSGPCTLVYAMCTRRDAQKLVHAARESDPELVFCVDPISESTPLTPLPHATGWRAIFKKK